MFEKQVLYSYILLVLNTVQLSGKGNVFSDAVGCRVEQRSDTVQLILFFLT